VGVEAFRAIVGEGELALEDVGEGAGELARDLVGITGKERVFDAVANFLALFCRY
jgi:hypothetical protein